MPYEEPDGVDYPPYPTGEQRSKEEQPKGDYRKVDKQQEFYKIKISLIINIFQPEFLEGRKTVRLNIDRIFNDG